MEQKNNKFKDFKENVGNVTTVIKWTPLILLVLYLIYLVITFIISAKEGGFNSKSFILVFQRLLNILHMILKPLIYILKLIVKGIFYFIPEFISNFVTRYKGFPIDINGGDAWKSRNLLTTLVGIISIILLIASGYIINYKNECENDQSVPCDDSGWNLAKGSMGWILFGLGIIALGYGSWVFIKSITTKEGEKGNKNVFPKEEDFSIQKDWLFKRTKTYLFAAICFIVAIAMLGGFAYLIAKAKIPGETATYISMVLSIIMLLFILHIFFTKTHLLDKLKKNRFFELIYHLIFIIPCAFTDIVNYIYEQLYHTPKIAYYILTGEIVFVCLYLLIDMFLPIFKKNIYLNVNYNKTASKTYEIQAINDGIDILETDILNLKNIHDKIDGGPFWKGIFDNKLHIKNKKEQLKAWILTSSHGTIKDADEIKKLIDEVYKRSSKIYSKRNEIADLKAEIEQIEKREKGGEGLPISAILQSEPKKLNQRNFIGDYKNMNKDGKLPINSFSYDYGLSCWIYLNSTPPNHYVKHIGKDKKTQTLKWYNILNFSNKPKISYNPHKNKLRISTTLKGVNNRKHFEIKNIKLQKWINLVINYDGGILDVFMDGILVYSESGIIPYMSTDTVIIGEKHGIKGAICNVTYFASHLSKMRITSNYEYLKNNNPPVV